jgi:hypothetical protein
MQVNSLRSGCGHIFQTFQDVARAPDGGAYVLLLRFALMDIV